MNRRLTFLVGATLLLAGYASWNYMVSWNAPGAAAPQPDAAPIAKKPIAAARQPDAPDLKTSAGLNPLDTLDPQGFGAITARPLFNPSRRPRIPEPPPAPALEAAEEPAVAAVPEGRVLSAVDFTLIAVSTVQERSVAVVRVNGSNDVLYLREGQPLLDWRVLRVGTRDITVGAEGESITLEMFNTPHPPTVAPAEGIDIAQPPEGEASPDTK